MPHAVQVAVAFAHADIAETGFAVHGEAWGIFSHHLCLQGPVARSFRYGNQPLQQGRADPVSMGGGSDIDADLSDSGGASGIRHGGECRPASDRFIFRSGDQSSSIEMTFVPGFPSGRVRHECGKPGRETFGIQRANLFPILAAHVFNGRN